MGVVKMIPVIVIPREVQLSVEWNEHCLMPRVSGPVSQRPYSPRWCSHFQSREVHFCHLRPGVVQMLSQRLGHMASNGLTWTTLWTTSALAYLLGQASGVTTGVSHSTVPDCPEGLEGSCVPLHWPLEGHPRASSNTTTVLPNLGGGFEFVEVLLLYLRVKQIRPGEKQTPRDLQNNSDSLSLLLSLTLKLTRCSGNLRPPRLLHLQHLS
ncbi:hypothetical protein DNTS_000482 [Danionella cerebrum]|uniref:Uncharacterized protein n=1 Tax=Danionella cerebrum TaxID=2873325 RepID=A0A553Q0G8_9TELE|nr:hypothetical protein DNTS_000482 [Danionella translucida]